MSQFAIDDLNFSTQGTNHSTITVSRLCLPTRLLPANTAQMGKLFSPRHRPSRPAIAAHGVFARARAHRPTRIRRHTTTDERREETRGGFASVFACTCWAEGIKQPRRWRRKKIEHPHAPTRTLPTALQPYHHDRPALRMTAAIAGNETTKHV